MLGSWTDLIYILLFFSHIGKCLIFMYTRKYYNIRNEHKYLFIKNYLLILSLNENENYDVLTNASQTVNGSEQLKIDEKKEKKQ